MYSIVGASDNIKESLATVSDTEQFSLVGEKTFRLLQFALRYRHPKRLGTHWDQAARQIRHQRSLAG